MPQAQGGLVSISSCWLFDWTDDYGAHAIGDVRWFGLRRCGRACGNSCGSEMPTTNYHRLLRITSNYYLAR